MLFDENEIPFGEQYDRSADDRGFDYWDLRETARLLVPACGVYFGGAFFFSTFHIKFHSGVEVQVDVYVMYVLDMFLHVR